MKKNSSRRLDRGKRIWRGMGVFWLLVEINPAICFELVDEKADFCRHHQTLRTSWEPASLLMEHTARPVWLLGDLFITLVYPSLSLKHSRNPTVCGMGFKKNRIFVGQMFL